MKSVSLVLLYNFIETVSGPPSPPEDIFLNVTGPGFISLSWPPSPAYFNKTLTYELHALKDDKLIDVIHVNETVYEYTLEGNECSTYRFVVYSVNEAGTSSNSTGISLTLPIGKHHFN